MWRIQTLKIYIKQAMSDYSTYTDSDTTYSNGYSEYSSPPSPSSTISMDNLSIDEMEMKPPSVEWKIVGGRWEDRTHIFIYMYEAKQKIGQYTHYWFMEEYERREEPIYYYSKFKGLTEIIKKHVVEYF